MGSARDVNDTQLKGVVDEKLTSLVRELEDANWTFEEIVFSIEAVLVEKWLTQARALRAARENVPNNFVSDGNEG
ncbi:hypothetical protein [Rhizobium sp. SYY.PMSO]|uniref:hypothetical protein n=1 Tax=Rhizobium sp. SYY.PMSO TaxID=3382192 RepID=UPI000DDEC376